MGFSRVNKWNYKYNADRVRSSRRRCRGRSSAAVAADFSARVQRRNRRAFGIPLRSRAFSSVWRVERVRSAQKTAHGTLRGKSKDDGKTSQKTRVFQILKYSQFYSQMPTAFSRFFRVHTLFYTVCSVILACQ